MSDEPLPASAPAAEVDMEQARGACGADSSCPSGLTGAACPVQVRLKRLARLGSVVTPPLPTTTTTTGAAAAAAVPAVGRAAVPSPPIVAAVRTPPVRTPPADSMVGVVLGGSEGAAGPAALWENDALERVLWVTLNVRQPSSRHLAL
jgi:hypothetical protein